MFSWISNCLAENLSSIVHFYLLRLDKSYESGFVHWTEFLACRYLQHAVTTRTGYLLPSSAVIPYSCFAIFFLAIFPRLQRGPTFYSLLSFSRPLSLSPSSGPSIRPYDHAIPRRWSSAHQGLYSFHPFCHPLSAHIHRRNALAYTLKGTCTQHVLPLSVIAPRC